MSRRVLSGTVAAPLTVGAGRHAHFPVIAAAVDVKTTATTSYKKGVVTDLALGRNVQGQWHLRRPQLHRG